MIGPSPLGLQLLKSLRMSGLRRDISHLVLNKQMLVLMIRMLSLMNRGTLKTLLWRGVKSDLWRLSF
ncbi:unnamed protein product, partial [Vitis vinifera]|uniref:Uncharacterized protein n=1 Tax=Vitis vinifera TaxID=29760 RepID=D7TG34_VITVI